MWKIIALKSTGAKEGKMPCPYYLAWMFTCPRLCKHKGCTPARKGED